MKKRIYKAITVNRINRPKMEEAVKGMRVVFGIDIAKDINFGRLVTEQREVVVTVKWHQIGETNEMIEFLQSLPASLLTIGSGMKQKLGNPRDGRWADS